jgi:hypothetical protein
MNRLTAWLTEPVPLGRIAAFRTLVYLFAAADLVAFTPWVRTHAAIPGELYQPLLIGRLLPLPVPGPWLVHGIFWLLLAASLAAATGRAPRLLGWTVFALYFEWMVIAMSYGKVDHDRFAYLVALAVLPTVGRARHGDRSPSQAGGWTLRVTQIAVVATYFLSAWAKVRFGGWDWGIGSVLARAFLRRGTDLADLIAPIPYVLIGMQIGILAFEFSSPAVFLLRGRARYLGVAAVYGFHAMTFAMVTISFMPQLVALAAFLPLEKVRPVAWLRTRARRGGDSPAEVGNLLVSDGQGSVGRLGTGERALRGREGAGGGAAGHAVAVPGHPPVGGAGEREGGSGREDRA